MNTSLCSFFKVLCSFFVLVLRRLFFSIDSFYSDTVYWINPQSKPIIASYQRIILLISTLIVIQQCYIVVFHFFKPPWRSFKPPWRFVQPLFHFVKPLCSAEKVQSCFKITLCSAEIALSYSILTLAHPILVDCSNSYRPVRNIYLLQKQNYISL